MTVEDRALLVDIIRNPDAYFNVHNSEFQPGALRGQLSDLAAPQPAGAPR